MENKGEDKYGCCGAHESKKSRGRQRSQDLCYTDVPEGYLPVYVGMKELRRFVISASFLNHPIFAELLQKSAQEYGYEQKGGLKIPCDVMLFEHIIFLLNNQEAVTQTLRLSDMK
jgi:SAUR family protein